MSFHNPFCRARPKRVSESQSARLGRLLQVRLKWWRESRDSGADLICGICHKPITRYEELASDHREPGKMGGCRNDAEENLQPAHRWCNQEKGSNRKPVEKLVKRKPGRIMKKSEAEKYLAGTVCFCDGTKREKTTFCESCLKFLSAQQLHDLQTLEHKEYLDKVAECELTILQGRVKAQTRAAE